MPNQTAAYTVQSMALHQLVAHAMKFDPPKSVPTIMMVSTFLEPVAGMLYVISSIPTVRVEGVWFLRMEKNGMVRPNTRTIIPFFVLLYIAFSMTTIHCFQNDLTKSYLSTLTVTLSLSTYPFMLCTGWTKIWNVLRTVPLTRYGLITTMRQTNANSTLSYFKPRTLNLLSIFFYLFPFVFAGPSIYWIALDLIEIENTYKQYNHAFSTIMTGKLTSNTILQLNIKALGQTAFMKQRAEKVIFHSRVISFGYAIYVVMLFFMMIFGYFRILEAVRHQIRTFRQAIDQHQLPLSLNIPSTGNLSVVQASPVSTNFDVSSFSDGSVLEKGSSTRPRPARLGMEVVSWLPSLRPDPDFLDQACTSNVASDYLNSNEQQPWEKKNRAIFNSQCKALQRYQVNLFWQVSCNTILMIALVVMDYIIFSNALHIPTRHKLSDLNWFSISMANVTWLSTVGIPFGLVAVVVAFSSPITTLRERTEVVKECDY
ncbi:hypothetical protein MJO29_007136 [Puccinia striiformis f. sp. tritici]|nr:hypothetical protein MJO29_007136 [Puccinia striiformis f. sp. tritici]